MAANAEVHASTNRMSELGMARATGRAYEHVLEQEIRTLDTA